MIKKKYIKILDKNIAYFDEGHGDNLIFIHGNPTSSYLWRNIIHSLKLKYRCIAPDLIGMGDSDKLNNVSNQSYSFFEHKKWLNEFIDNLNLEKKFHLVLHDWGSALGFDYAKENEDKISGIVYMEAIVCPLEWKDWPENARNIFKLLRGKAGEDLIYNKNIFIEKILPSSIIRDLSEQEMQEYKKPYLCGGYHRQPTLSWPRQIPLGGKPENINKLVYNYAEFMKETNIKKLFINAKPGSILVGRQRNFYYLYKM